MRPVEEDVVGLGSYERLLTVLMTEETAQEEEDSEVDQDDYIDRWKTESSEASANLIEKRSEEYSGQATNLR